jgi:hypothetical protein
MKPISATKANECDNCNEKLVNYQGQDKIRFCCSFASTDNVTFSKPCTMRDWAKCPYNEDK